MELGMSHPEPISGVQAKFTLLERKKENVESGKTAVGGFEMAHLRKLFPLQVFLESGGAETVKGVVDWTRSQIMSN